MERCTICGCDLNRGQCPERCTLARARFWVWINDGWARVTIRNGQELHHHRGAPTDEGWESESHRWAFDGVTVTQDWFSDGSDCDGRLSSGASVQANAEQRNSMTEDYSGAPLPEGVRMTAWERVDCFQRDYQAEAAGY